MKKLGYIILAAMVIFFGLIVIGSNSTSSTPKHGDAWYTAYDDVHAEQGCRQQVSISDACSATLTRLDFARALISHEPAGTDFSKMEYVEFISQYGMN